MDMNLTLRLLALVVCEKEVDIWSGYFAMEMHWLARLDLLIQMVAPSAVYHHKLFQLESVMQKLLGVGRFSLMVRLRNREDLQPLK
jgi:hypothetical protein